MSSLMFVDSCKFCRHAPPGQIRNNGFINFMRDFRQYNNTVDLLELTKMGAKTWNKLDVADRKKYLEYDCGSDDGDDNQASDSCGKKKKKVCCTPEPPQSCPKKKKKKTSCKPKAPACPKPRKKKSKCPRKPKCGKKRVKCSKPGPVTNNGYLNFIRKFRACHCGMKPKELIMKAARAWCRMSEQQKDRYRRMACKITKSPRHKRRRVCTGNYPKCH